MPLTEYKAEEKTVSAIGTSLRPVNGWLIILPCIDNFPTDLEWPPYQNDFGDITSNFWLGLERIYQLTNRAVNGGKTYRTRILLQSDTNGL